MTYSIAIAIFCLIKVRKKMEKLCIFNFCRIFHCPQILLVNQMHKQLLKIYTNICSNKIKQNHKILAPPQNISEYIKYWRLMKILTYA
jgi:hypothetical protein